MKLIEWSRTAIDEHLGYCFLRAIGLEMVRFIASFISINRLKNLDSRNLVAI